MCACVPPCPLQTHETTELKVIDAVGNPIIVRGLLEFGVEDAAALHIATNSSFSVLFNMAEQVPHACTWPHSVVQQAWVLQWGTGVVACA